MPYNSDVRAQQQLVEYQKFVELTLAVAASTDTELVYGSMDWEEVSR